MPKSLALGMTIGLRSSQGRVFDYAAQAIISLRKAGFQEPLHVFIEPGALMHVPNAGRWNLVVHKNKQKLGCFPNFKRGIQWLLKNEKFDWVMMLQDDATWRKQGSDILHAAINHPDHQRVGFLSPYTSVAMVGKGRKKELRTQVDEKRDIITDWVDVRFHNRAFWGAVAMCFPRDRAEGLQTARRYKNHKHHRKLDVVVGNTILRDCKQSILVAVPSLVDHIGTWSTLGRHRIKGNQWGRRGVAFNVPAG